MQLEVLLLDAGLAATGTGLLGLARPIPRLGLAPRRRVAVLLAAGLGLTLVGALLPPRAPRLPGPAMTLDLIVPDYEFGESHEVRVEAQRETVWHALLELRADEIRLFRTLTWLRSPHLGSAAEGILNPSASRPVLESARLSGFVELAREPGRELVIGAIVCCGPRPRIVTAQEYRALDGPDLVRAVMNFHLADEGASVRLTTQTRIHATGPLASRRFGAYWRVIYPGSAFIRRMWLDAIKRRAEGRLA